MSTDANPPSKPSVPDAPRDDEHFEEGAEAAPPGVRAAGIVRWTLLVLVMVAAAISIYSYARTSLGDPTHAHEGAARYYCPMHPQITADAPGECPICHMNLEPIPADRRVGAPSPAGSPAPPASSHEVLHAHADLTQGSAAPAATTGAPGPDAGVDTRFTCPMHRKVLQAGPGSCPICNMDLVPVSSLPPPAPEPPPGTSELTLTFERLQKIGVRTALAERVAASEPIRVTAIVEAPEKGLAEVHSRAAGFVEAIRVRDTGVRVKAGQLLASIYSPEIFQAQQELLTIASWSDPGASSPDIFRPPMEPARKRLELLGLDVRSIDAIVKSGKAQRAVPVHAPISGYVTKKSVVLGSSVTPEMPLFEIADLDHVYVVASVHPTDLARLRVGDGAVFTTPTHPNRPLAAKVALVLPDVDRTTRTARARFELDNHDLALRPGQFGVVEITGKTAEVVVVPIDAVVDLGRSVYVFRDEGGGRFTPVTVELGEQLGDKLVVRSGLREGERVVSGATFLIDAESRLRASFAERSSKGSTPAPASACDAEFDRAKYPDKWAACRKCEEVHRGMGAMVDDCKNAIAKPWR